MRQKLVGWLVNERVDVVVFFFFNDTATTEIYTLSLHDALPIYQEHNLGTLLAYFFVVHCFNARGRQ